MKEKNISFPFNLTRDLIKRFKYMAIDEKLNHGELLERIVRENESTTDYERVRMYIAIRQQTLDKLKAQAKDKDTTIANVIEGHIVKYFTGK